MEVEVAIPLPNLEFNFDSTSSSPFMTAPSSPQRFGNLYFSAPTSPTRASAFLHELRNSRRCLSSIPFAWEEKPGVPKRRGSDQSGGGGDGGNDDYDFEFDFSGQLDRASASADELFDGGKIRPLKPPPRLQANSGDADSVMNSLPASPRSPSRFAQGKKMVQEVLSPRHPKRDFDPFSAALEETRKREMNLNKHEDLTRSRGRERKGESSSSLRTSSASYVRKGTRSLSPLRVSDIMEADREAEERAAPSSSSNHASSYFSSLLSSMSFSKGYRKWSFKDFLLFRSASEGRGTAKDPLRKYVALWKRSSFNYAPADEVKGSSFRSTESAGSVSSRRRSGAAPVSAHELHYTLNRAVSEEMKKKTSLPYKHGLLGCLGFNPPPGVRDLARVLRMDRPGSRDPN